MMDEPDTDDALEELFAPEEAKAFVLRHVRPADSAMEEALEGLRRQLGQRDGSDETTQQLWLSPTLETTVLVDQRSIIH